MPAWLVSLAATASLLVIWEIVIDVFLPHVKVWPSPSQIISQIYSDGWSFYWPNARTTLWEAFAGFVWGNVVAISVAIIAVTVPILEKPLTQLGVISYCLPIVAVGSIFAIVFNGETSKIVLAAMAVFFTTFTGTVLGLRSSSTASLDVVRAYGGGRFQQLLRVRLWASLPSVFASLRIAAPAAVLGAMIGEYLGEQNSGLGQAMVASEQAFNVARTWGIAFVTTAAGGLAFAIIAFAGTRLTPWNKASSK